MNLIKYPSIHNSYQQRVINTIIEMGKDKEEWIATVKVHGTNFSMHTDGKVVLPASKNEFTDDSFFGCQSIVDANTDGLIELYQMLNRYNHDSVREVGVYGELFGGHYNHPDVPRNPSANRIMKGVSYSPDNHFYLFGMTINGEWVSHDFAIASSFYLKCLSAYELGRGTLQECLEIPNDTLDPIHKFFGLPEVSDNIIEGVVIEPQYPFILPNGTRAIIKNKNEKFKEKANKSDRVKIPVVIPDDVQAQFDEIELYVTENRLQNVISHIGEIAESDVGNLIGEFSKDVLDDYLKDNEDMYKSLDKKGQGMVRKHGQRLSAGLIKPKIREIVG